MIRNLFKASSFICLFVSSLLADDTRVFNPRTVIPRPFPAIVDPTIVSAEEAEGEFVRDRELVLGVVINGEARAYPINVLTGPRREIINDSLGKRSIAATW